MFAPQGRFINRPDQRPRHGAASEGHTYGFRDPADHTIANLSCIIEAKTIDFAQFVDSARVFVASFDLRNDAGFSIGQRFRRNRSRTHDIVR